MQEAQSPDILDAEGMLKQMVEEMRQTVAEVTDWVRDLGFLEAWKRVADQRVQLIFNSMPIISGPTLPDNLKEHAVEELYRVTWFVVCWGMTSDERSKAWRENGDAIKEYSLALAERATAERWKYALANARQG